ncbi:hypothetical protein LCGC14_1189740 [marine sediment metagenome]|uniref:Uncharacterized protein n=1 Tax=marine sediment metagenome TaxID=412755 RepID=A0A0F9LPQ3_9ZZZZ
MTDPQTDTEAQITVRDMVCSTCWGSLAIHPAPDRMNNVLCRSNCEETKGYVSKAWAEQEGSKRKSELLEVQRAYPELAGKQKLDQTEDDINDSLGF